MKQRQTARKALLFGHVCSDAFFEKLVHDLVDFGCDIRFSAFGGSGAYHPFILATERLDSPEKQAIFGQNFLSIAMRGDLRARITLGLFASKFQHAHSLMHEMMHFYQDMMGAYFLPLHETGIFPVMPDLRSTVRIVLFNEAWAEVEVIRAAWAMNRRGHDLAWKGALRSRDWAYLARLYDRRLAGGVDEAKAAAEIFIKWYEGAHRWFYEEHALNVFEAHIKQFSSGLEGGIDYNDRLRRVGFCDIIARLPENERPSYFNQIMLPLQGGDQIQSSNVLRLVEAGGGVYCHAEDRAVSDIRHGAPAYLWRQLRIREVSNADIPAQMLGQSGH